MSLIILAEARARDIALPADDDAAQDIIDEQEAWLARKVGLLQGERTETFYVGQSATHGKLGLRRYTDSVVLTDAGAGVAADQFRLIDNGSSVVLAYIAPSRWWMGPYVTAKYTPTDLSEVRRVLFGLIALEAAPPGQYDSETIGSYSYTRVGQGGLLPSVQRAALVSSLLPKRDAAYTIHAVSRWATKDDPVINHPEPPDPVYW